MADTKAHTPDLSVVIPAHNEEGCIASTVETLVEKLQAAKINHEIVVVNDGSRDRTGEILEQLQENHPSVRSVRNTGAHGFGLAIRRGLAEFRGKSVAIYMADASDSPDELVTFYRTMVQKNVDGVFGNRWIRGGRVYDYPKFKYYINRLVNTMISLLFGIRYNDVTNAFKLYRREVIAGVQPVLSHHFNLTVELPLKAIVRGYSFEVIPNSWNNRSTGESKLKIKEMGSRYLFIIVYCLIEKWLSRGDYHRHSEPLGLKVVTSGHGIHKPLPIHDDCHFKPHQP